MYQLMLLEDVILWDILCYCSFDLIHIDCHKQKVNNLNVKETVKTDKRGLS